MREFLIADDVTPNKKFLTTTPAGAPSVAQQQVGNDVSYQRIDLLTTTPVLANY